MTLLNDKAKRIIRLAYEEIGSPYVFGAIGEDCTPFLRGRRQRSDHPTIRSKCQVLTGTVIDGTCFGCPFQGRRMYDCRGFTYWLLKQVGITISAVGATTQYNTASSWIRRGNIIHMPDVVCCVFVQNGSKMSHTGMHIGGGVVIDCSTGVTEKTTKGFTHYAIPRGLYSEEELQNAEEVADTEPLQKGSRGERVRELQTLLNKTGYNCETVDGIFGSKTFTAVTTFQADHDLDVTGIADDETIAKLEKVYTFGEEEKQETPAEDSPAPTDPELVTLQLTKDVAEALVANLQRALAKE